MSSSQGDLFFSLDALPRDSRACFRELLDQPIVPMAQLREEIEGYLETISAVSHEYEFMDTGTAEAIAGRYFELLESFEDGLSERQRRLLQAGVRYFIESHDAEDDFSSPIGFDDDRDVTNLIVEKLGRDDLKM